MTADRKKPEGHNQVALHQDAVTPLGLQTEDRLLSWLLNAIGASLVEDGLPQALVDRILQEAFQDYARFRRGTIKRPHLFLIKSVGRRAAQRMKLHDVEPAPDEQPVSVLRLARTKEALDTLPPNMRTALSMLYGDDRSHEEIAMKLDISVEAARRLIRRALALLSKWQPRE